MRVQELEALSLLLRGRHDRETEEVRPSLDRHGTAQRALQHCAGHAERRVDVFAEVAELEGQPERKHIRRRSFVARLRGDALHPFRRVLRALGRGRAAVLDDEEVRDEQSG